MKVVVGAGKGFPVNNRRPIIPVSGEVAVVVGVVGGGGVIGESDVIKRVVDGQGHGKVYRVDFE